MAADVQPPNEAEMPTLPPPPGATAPMERAAAPARSTVGDSWSWLWKDTLGRVVPLTAGAVIFARLTREGRREGGVTRRHLGRDVALGVVAGIPMAAIAAVFRGWVAPNYRLPTPADQALQTGFYFGLNAPAEELFWRGTVQALAEKGAARLPHMRRAAPWLGWAFATTTFGLYHRLGNWSWRSIAGVTVAGGFFGALYQLQRRPRSLLAPVLVHGFATAGFLSWGDVYLHLRGRYLRARRVERAPAEGYAGAGGTADGEQTSR